MSFQSLFPSSLLGTSNSSHPSTLTSSSSMSSYRASDRPQSPSTGLPSPEAAGIIAHLKDKSTDELRKLLTDKNVYEAFFNSLDHVKDQRNMVPKQPRFKFHRWSFKTHLKMHHCIKQPKFWSINMSLSLSGGVYNSQHSLYLWAWRGANFQFIIMAYHIIDIHHSLLWFQLSRELQEETIQLSRENLEKETRMSELGNQCMIIRTTELADAQEKLKGLEKQKDEILRFYSPLLMLQNFQDAMNKDEEESETLHKKLLEKEVDLTTFLRKYNKLRNDYHRRALVHLAAKTSVM